MLDIFFIERVLKSCVTNTQKQNTVNWIYNLINNSKKNVKNSDDSFLFNEDTKYLNKLIKDLDI